MGRGGAALGRCWCWGSSCSLPHSGGFVWRLLVLAVGLPVLCVVLALVESALAKMRLLRVPRLLAIGSGLCLLGLITWFLGGGA